MNKENVILKQLVNRVLKNTAIYLMATKCDTVQECRIIWTTYKNIKFWFDNWLVNLEDIGFALRDKKTRYTSLQSIFTTF